MFWPNEQGTSVREQQSANQNTRRRPDGVQKGSVNQLDRLWFDSTYLGILHQYNAMAVEQFVPLDLGPNASQK